MTIQNIRIQHFHNIVEYIPNPEFRHIHIINYNSASLLREVLTRLNDKMSIRTPNINQINSHILCIIFE
jgi:hypothetical protein